MEEKKKRVRFNLFDVIVILLVLVVAIAAYLILNSSEESSSGESVSLTYTLELTGLEEDMADAVAVGDEFYVTESGGSVGVVTEVVESPDTTLAYDVEEELVVTQEISDTITLDITLEADVLEYSDAFETADEDAIRIGTSLTVSNGKIIGTGYVIGIEREDAE